MLTTPSLQETYTPDAICFGCGPANPNGLQLKSYVTDDLISATWQPQHHHQAFENMVNGGIISTLLDCHSAWAAAWFIKQFAQLPELPTTVTAEYTVRFRRPTPLSLFYISAHPIHIENTKAVIKAQICIDGKMTASSEGTFIAVSDKHPAHQSRQAKSCIR